ncbi:DUF1746-domain-containing protein [Saitoella complicata NRRL Y-17804]|uniref:DUF1746 domain-containing protein n=1 Tax=Saitoella complicata (strain BCRC 22490 / CBS 7301 / JCM 7358 / NBRC 10748 / NRRL Y-17804) TaxID=698492 RepID=A0A0E9NN50_SAICN|nr:DUF1746-domain-containing protein [Saitoella complicata NRRL Y-17804]ODQ51056.1 DUF1746-domain-containing protein [Saitoella complicata NRRL Y-17804]GAO51228.1 hypothetical protein G7K_5336-t1 [Saitoella complicata NRRL Y-17804]
MPSESPSAAGGNFLPTGLRMDRRPGSHWWSGPVPPAVPTHTRPTTNGIGNDNSANQRPMGADRRPPPVPATTGGLPGSSVFSALAATPSIQNSTELSARNHPAYLLSCLDLLVYANMIYIYFLDTSFLRLLIRAFIHARALSPKPFPVPDPPLRLSSIFFVWATFLFPFIDHIISGGPEGAEGMGGYLHGGIVINFVGEMGSVSRWRLCALDLLILGIQCVMLSLVTMRHYPSSAALTAPAPQTIEDEEAGVRTTRRGYAQVADEDEDEDDIIVTEGGKEKDDAIQIINPWRAIRIVWNGEGSVDEAPTATATTRTASMNRIFFS